MNRVHLLGLIWAVMIPHITGQDFQRTIIMFFSDTEPGESISIRGGIDHTQRPGCTNDATTSACAIPIVHRVVPTDPGSSYLQWSVGDNYLDWYGPEVGQGDYQGTPAGGTPLMYTQDTNAGETVDVDGYGYTPLNRFGPGYWMLDVDMDCSLTESGWFEFKGYKTPIDAWEPDVAQFSKCAGVPEMSTPYTGLNHMGLCGKMNVYYWLFDDCQMFDVPDPIIAPPGGCGQRKMFDIPTSTNAVSPAMIVNGDPTSISTNAASPAMIVNGDPAVVGWWPWQGILQYGSVIGGCAASLINSNWAVTAGHCVRGTNPLELKVRLGEQNLYANQNTEQAIQVVSINTHSRYENPIAGDVLGDFDISMLELATPVDFTKYPVNEACVPYGYALDAFVGLSTCWATGFGDTLGTGEDYRLNEINIPVWTHADCVARYGDNYISERQVCMGTDTLSPCGGDSGGPLVCYTSANEWVLVGITSWGEDGCQNGPGVYTRITEFTDWIDSFLTP